MKKLFLALIATSLVPSIQTHAQAAGSSMTFTDYSAKLQAVVAQGVSTVRADGTPRLKARHQIIATLQNPPVLCSPGVTCAVAAQQVTVIFKEVAGPTSRFQNICLRAIENAPASKKIIMRGDVTYNQTNATLVFTALTSCFVGTNPEIR